MQTQASHCSAPGSARIRATAAAAGRQHRRLQPRMRPGAGGRDAPASAAAAHHAEQPLAGPAPCTCGRLCLAARRLAHRPGGPGSPGSALHWHPASFTGAYLLGPVYCAFRPRAPRLLAPCGLAARDAHEPTSQRACSPVNACPMPWSFSRATCAYQSRPSCLPCILWTCSLTRGRPK